MDTSEMVELSAEFAELTVQVHGDGDAEAALLRVLQLAVKHVPGCSWASITEVRRGDARSVASSDPVAAQIDAIQHRLDEGPCVQAADDHDSVLLFDVETEPRWPRFAAQAAAETPLRCVLAIRLPGKHSSALNFYADQPGAFDDDALGAASILAAHTAAVLAIGEAEEQKQHLESALHSNRQIGTAMGVLMARHKITEDQAFTVLRVASQNLHRKLRDIAAEVTETGALPEVPVRPEPENAPA